MNTGKHNAAYHWDSETQWDKLGPTGTHYHVIAYSESHYIVAEELLLMCLLVFAKCSDFDYKSKLNGINFTTKRLCCKDYTPHVIYILLKLYMKILSVCMLLMYNFIK